MFLEMGLDFFNVRWVEADCAPFLHRLEETSFYKAVDGFPHLLPVSEDPAADPANQ